MYELAYQAYTLALWFRGIELLLICGGAIFCCYLGYRLYQSGILTGKEAVEVRHKLWTLVVTGEGPGMFFMVFGACVLCVAIWRGGTELEATGAPSIPALQGGSLVFTMPPDFVATAYKPQPQPSQQLAAAQAQLATQQCPAPTTKVSDCINHGKKGKKHSHHSASTTAAAGAKGTAGRAPESAKTEDRENKESIGATWGLGLFDVGPTAPQMKPVAPSYVPYVPSSIRIKQGSLFHAPDSFIDQNHRLAIYEFPSSMPSVIADPKGMEF
jgi:hypothetical protein